MNFVLVVNLLFSILRATSPFHPAGRSLWMVFKTWDQTWYRCWSATGWWFLLESTRVLPSNDTRWVATGSSCRIGKYPSSPIATLSLLCLHLTGFIDIVQSLYLLYNSLQVEGPRKPPSQTCLFTPLLGGVIIVYLGPPPSSFNHNFCTSMTGKSYFLASVTNTYCWCWSRNPAHHWSLASDYTNFLEGLYASWKCFF